MLRSRELTATAAHEAQMMVIVVLVETGLALFLCM